MKNTIQLVALLIATAALGQPALAQSSVSDNGRTNPAPWRPSFGPVQQDAFPNPPASQPPRSDQSPRSDRWEPSGSTAVPPAARPAGNPQGVGNQNGNVRDDRSDRFGDARFGAAPDNRPGITRVSRTFERLPNDAGQVWREYDITPYTSQIKDTHQPQAAVMDWILKETGTQLWFSQPMGILSSDSKKVIVYHTPEIQREVRSIIDRFNRTRAQVQLFDVNLVTVQKPNWRSRAYPVLQPIEVVSPGIEAWMVSKENAAVLQAELSRRGDYRLHSGGRAASPDGQTFELQKASPVSFVQSIEWLPDQFPNYRPKTKSINEGFRLAISCLTSLDNRTIEAIIDCDVDQVEKLTPVKVDLPAPGGVLNQIELKVPQLVSWRLNERIRWPSDQVLLLSCGIVANPEAQREAPNAGAGILSRLRPSKRSDALLFVEYRGPQNGATIPRAADAGSRLVPIGR